MTTSPRIPSLACFMLALTALSDPARAQNLSGSYVHQAQQGQIRLVLEHTGNQVTGTMTGIEGSVSRLRGEFDGQKAVGTISTEDASGWFAAGFFEDRVTLLIAEIDPVTGQPNLDDGWRLDFTRAAGAAPPAGPAAGPLRAPQRSPAQQGAGAPQPAVTPLVQQWTQHLSGKKVTFMESYYSSDAGGSGGFSNQWDAYLCSDGTFHFRRSGGVSVDAGGGSGNARSNNAFSGRWRIIEQNGQAIVQYQREEQLGTDEGEWVALGFRDGNVYFDSSMVFVTNENDRCR
jgi:hypothetical protein